MEFSISVLSSIVAAIVVAITVAIWRWDRLRELSSAIWSILKLHLRLSSIGMVRFIRDREDYKHGKSDGIARYVRSARKTVQIVGINLITGVDSDDLLTAIRDKINSSDSPISVTISLLDPKNPMAMAAISQNHGKAKTELASSIRSSLRNLILIRDSLSPQLKNRLIVKAHSTLPFASAIIIDGAEPWGEIQIETKPYKQPINKSIGFTLRNGTRHALYQTLVSSYQQLIDDARLLEDESSP